MVRMGRSRPRRRGRQAARSNRTRSRAEGCTCSMKTLHTFIPSQKQAQQATAQEGSFTPTSGEKRPRADTLPLAKPLSKFKLDSSYQGRTLREYNVLFRFCSFAFWGAFFFVHPSRGGAHLVLAGGGGTLNSSCRMIAMSSTYRPGFC
jgi:hypothetical protein